MTTHRVWTSAAVFAAAGAAIAGVLVATQPRASASAGLHWEPCPGQGDPVGMECSQIQVPVDWDHPSGRTITMRLGRLKNTDPQHRLGTVVYNAGGPGPANIPTLPRYAPNLAGLRARFDVVTWDPRGASGTWGGEAQEKACEKDGIPFSLPRNRADYDAKARANQAAYQRCRAVDPELFDHLDSRQQARDLEAIRAALDEPALNFIGQSYGAVVATTYLRLFPDRVRAIYLDSVVNHVTDINADDAMHNLELETLFSQFAGWCAGDAGCALHNEDVHAVWRTLVANANRDPVPVPGSNPAVSYSGDDMIRTAGAFLASARFAEFATAIDAARHGDALPITGPARAIPGFKPVFPPSSAATECADGDLYSDYSAQQSAVAAGKRLAPDFPAERPAYHSVCIGWPQPVANPRAPLPGSGLPPIVGAAAIGDIRNTRAVVDQVPNSTTITVDGIGHGQYLGLGNPCVIPQVNRYFIDGTVPPPNTTCPAP
ncbi:alpha/beta fold hydrolase [Amycolatopsis taiwanensis]|uniref:Peptidase n=1 Tax=Amycolatopsis taiwanensis TaxID=342230 RepID=A0A9W6R302_9PSEU|nr:alpha/beta hydrolase [Amycolatopsis taiwanensis]GLY67573.1 peptidase [Amycolatopsis taiwanensis]